MAASPSVGSEPDGRLVLDRLRELPGGPELIALAAGRDDVELVGGAVRDVLLGREPRELDVTVTGSSQALAERLATELGARPVEAHERFGTAVVRWDGGRIDIATRRSERYPAPGALPDVGPGSRESDRLRRDFTVNTLAVALSGPGAGRLDGAPGALEDLRGRRLRVLHEASFRDDPTRLLRLARYSARLGFRVEERTAALATEAVDGGALDTVSSARVGAELRLALAEPDPVAALGALDGLGVLAALHEAIAFEEPLTRAALDELPREDGAWPDVLLLASLLLPHDDYDAHDYETRLRVLLDGFELPAAERERTVHSALLAPRLAARLHDANAGPPSAIYAVAHDAPLEALALAAALAGARGQAAAADAARRWLSELRHVRLEIGGEELLAAGVGPGPEVGRRLRRALLRKLDGEVGGREQELAAALEDA